jgi:hypothetical protein
MSPATAEASKRRFAWSMDPDSSFVTSGPEW